MPNDNKAIGCKWVFCAKKNAFSNIMYYKAKLMAKGFTQVHIIGFYEIFAPIAKFTTV